VERGVLSGGGSEVVVNWIVIVVCQDVRDLTIPRELIFKSFVAGGDGDGCVFSEN
jgi:hypothetical protein